jgi:signal peptidase I
MRIIKGIINFTADILETVAFAGSIFIAIFLYVGFPTQVKGASMEPTLHTGERIISSKISYKLHKIQRGDIIVFQSPTNPNIDYVKRVIGLSKDVIMIKNGNIYVNNVLIDEKYISAKTNLWEGGFIKEGTMYIVPEKELFVMGDNRPRSSDSREFGPVPISSIVGKVVYRHFPPNKVGPIRNPFSD